MTRAELRDQMERQHAPDWEAKRLHCGARLGQSVDTCPYCEPLRRELANHCTGCQKPRGTISTHQMGTVEHPARCHICGMNMGPEHNCGGSIPAKEGRDIEQG